MHLTEERRSNHLAKCGCHKRHKLKAVSQDSADSDALNVLHVVNVGDLELPVEYPADEYLLDLDHGDINVDDLFEDSDNRSSPKDVVKVLLGEEMFSRDKINLPRSSERWPPRSWGKLYQEVDQESS
ncbi:hypothetical protein NDU88_009094 [Pleurodeles waltl]|uniref:Uncharacterized protein n=1 Tax=Pleurodeles waltl TaxID=8319 RepID=A0AAV7PR45_PLEWA|nr:hypothetical protein NDU88_009094 [Pleurodeles waltl]